MVADAEFQVSASIGIALAPRDARDAEALLAHADAAMYQAKETARGGWAVYAQAGRDPLERLAMAARLRRALDGEEFQLYYQPIFDTRTRRDDRRRGAAALARPRARRARAAERVHPRGRGDRADRADRRLGDRRGLRAAGRLGRARHAAADLGQRVAAPAAPASTSSPASSTTCAASGAEPARITIELTESAMQQDHADAEPILRELHDLGLRLALDDFGAGYSSLSRLREMPMDTLKIDRAFLREVPENLEAAAIVTAILSLARALGRVAVAEGVETEAQRQLPRGARVPARSRASCSPGRCRSPRSRTRMAPSSRHVEHPARVAGDGAQRAEGGEAAKAAALEEALDLVAARGARAGRPGRGGGPSTCARGRSRRSSRSRGASS